MARVIVELSVSLDGYSAGANVGMANPMGDGGERLHEWMFPPDSPQIRLETVGTAGAVVAGRRTFDLGVEPWGDDPPFHMPVFVVTRCAHEPILKKGGTTYHFVTDGIERALADARKAAAGKDVLVLGGADIIQQFIAARLVDELRLHLVHILLGDGTPLFRRGSDHMELKALQVTEGSGVTYLTFSLR